VAYLIDHPGTLRQYSARTNWRPSRPTGLVVVHSTEFPPSWTVAQQAAWLRERTTPGCYHDIADTHGGDLQLVPYEMGAWQDGTGSNGCALSIAFVCRTTDWAQMGDGQRKRTLRAGARCFARQQAWLKAHGYPPTPLRRLTRAQSDAGEAGFIAHGERDPDRRTDPGTKPPNLFPWDEFFTECRAALAGEGDDDMYDQSARDEVMGALHECVTRLRAIHPAMASVHIGVMDRNTGVRSVVLKLAGQKPVEVNAAELAATLAPLLAPVLAERVGASKEDVAAAIREVLGGLDGVTA
jgi:hypothetical protein